MAAGCMAAQNETTGLNLLFKRYEAGAAHHTHKAAAAGETAVDPSQWESVGYCLLEDDMLMLTRTVSYEADVRRSPDNPYIYCVYNPFKTQYEIMHDQLAEGLELVYDDSAPHYFFINATDPDNVFISSSPTGENNTNIDNPIPTGLSYAGMYENIGLFNLNRSGFRSVNPVTGFEQIWLGWALGMVSPGFDEGFYSEVNTFSLVLDYDASRDLSLIRNWNHVSTATIEENLFGRYILDDDKTRTWECEMVKHPTMERYALLNPFATGGNDMAPLIYDGTEHTIGFDLGNPEEVGFWDGSGMIETLIPTGYAFAADGGAQDIHLCFTANAIRDGLFGDFDPETDLTPYRGTWSKNSENGNEALMMDFSDAVDIVHNNAVLGIDEPADLFRVKAVLTTGIGAVDSDSPDTPAVYYNLQGIKVDNPAGGIYIRCRGNKVDKVLVP